MPNRVSLFFGRIWPKVNIPPQRVLDDGPWRTLNQPVLDVAWAQQAQELKDVLEAWRVNPIARQIVALTTSYVVGSGVTLISPDPDVNAWLAQWWNHEQNQMAVRLPAMCDELTRSGELFVVLSTNPVDGMSYVRFIPASRIDQIETADGDLETELRFHELTDTPQGRWWNGMDAVGSQQSAVGSSGTHPSAKRTPASFGASFILHPSSLNQVMLHFAINRPLGAVRGESDLAPMLIWLRRYSRMLEDRVRLNAAMRAWYWVVTVARGADVRAKREQYAHPPEPGSVLVVEEGESWQAVTPQVQGRDVEPDLRTVRLMIAAGAGVPLHFLSEGDTTNRATAQAMGDPTYRHYVRRQQYFLWLVERLARVAYSRAQATDERRRTKDESRMQTVDGGRIPVQSTPIGITNNPVVQPSISDSSRPLEDVLPAFVFRPSSFVPQMSATAPPIVQEDSALLANAASALAAALVQVRGQVGGSPDFDRKMLELVFKFAGETLDAEEIGAMSKA